MRPSVTGKSQLRHVEFELDLADADFADKGMAAGIAALRRIGERKQKAFVAARQRLQPRVAFHRKFHRLARDVAGDVAGGKLAVRLDQVLAGEYVRHARHRLWRCVAQLRLRDLRARGDFRIEQAVRVVEGRAEHLAARQVLVSRRDAPLGVHDRRIDWTRIAEARQCGAVGAHQEDRLDQIAARLHDGERRELPVVERALAHHPVDAEAELLDDLVEPERRHVAVAAPAVGEQPVGVADGGLTALDGNIHGSGLRLTNARGARQAGDALGRRKNEVDAARKPCPVLLPLLDEMARQRRRRDGGAAVDAGAFERQPVAGGKAGDLQDQGGRTIRILLRTLREIFERNQTAGSATRAKCASAGVLASGAPV